MIHLFWLAICSPDYKDAKGNLTGGWVTKDLNPTYMYGAGVIGYYKWKRKKPHPYRMGRVERENLSEVNE